MGSVWWRSAADERDLLRVLAAASEQGGGLAQFVQDWLGALLEYDSTRGSRLVRTLSVYLNCDGDYAMAARVLGVQRSTVRYRLGVIRELTRLDLSDGEIRLFLHAATRAPAHFPDSV
jgi:DNA-binding PucR family transcriptional regulator